MTGTRAANAGDGASGHHDYVAYGLRIRSQLALPLTPRDGTAVSRAEAPDVEVRFGTVPPALSAPAGRRRILHWETAPGVLLWRMEDMAGYLVAGGREITIEPAAGASERDLGVFLLGSVFAALLQQRGVLVLRASAIETERGAALFPGRSGSGKSALLAAMLERGHAMLADGNDRHRPRRGGSSGGAARLPRHASVGGTPSTGWAGGGARRGGCAAASRSIGSPSSVFASAPRPVHAAFVLGQGSEETVAIEPLRKADAWRALCNCTCRMRFLRGMEAHAEHFRLVTAMAERVPVARLTRRRYPRSLSESLDAAAERVESDLCGAPPMAAAGR